MCQREREIVWERRCVKEKVYVCRLILGIVRYSSDLLGSWSYDYTMYDQLLWKTTDRDVIIINLSELG